MSSTLIEVKITPVYNDMTTRTYTLPNVDMNELANVKTRVKKINAALGGDTSDTLASAYAADMRKTFVSAGGASMSSINKAQIVITEEEEIYSYGNG